ncbi:hypothetical protein IAF28_19800, partial [Acinetobacter baumannii]|nr:hypothetical protein [Acinetobacter baumannii]
MSLNGQACSYSLTLFASFAVPFCEKKNCIDVDIQTIKTQDAWLNSWIEKNQAKVIQAQIN